LSRGYNFALLKDCYVHHNGNTSSDFFGFDLSHIYHNNKQIYNNKIKEKNETTFYSDAIRSASLPEKEHDDSTNLKQKALFIFLGDLNGLLVANENIKKFKNKNPNYLTTMVCNTDFVDIETNSKIFDRVISSDSLITKDSSNKEILEVTQAYSKMASGYSYFKDWTMDIREGRVSSDQDE
jgi:hypothetical protein